MAEIITKKRKVGGLKIYNPTFSQKIGDLFSDAKNSVSYIISNKKNVYFEGYEDSTLSKIQETETNGDINFSSAAMVLSKFIEQFGNQGLSFLKNKGLINTNLNSPSKVLEFISKQENQISLIDIDKYKEYVVQGDEKRKSLDNTKQQTLVFLFVIIFLLLMKKK